MGGDFSVGARNAPEDSGIHVGGAVDEMGLLGSLRVGEANFAVFGPFILFGALPISLLADTVLLLPGVLGQGDLSRP